MGRFESAAERARLFEGRPWANVPLDGMLGAPGMLGPEERQFLYYCAREFYDGAGEIIDAGAFLGASALALGLGLRDNPRVADKKGRIHSYDFFEFADFHRPYLAGHDLKPGQDTLPFFRKITEPAAAQITPLKGDICAQKWRGGDIDILFVDFTQTWDHHEFVVREFYPRLVPGRSLLIHEDYLYSVCYWLHAFMEYYAECFQPLADYIPYASAAWLLVKPLPAEAFETPLYRRLTFQEVVELIDRSLRRYSGVSAVSTGLVKCARARALMHALGTDAAREYALSVAEEYRNDEILLPHIRLVFRELAQLAGSPPELANFYRADPAPGPSGPPAASLAIHDGDPSFPVENIAEVGDSDAFGKSGQETFRCLLGLAGLHRDANVLEVGCGLGRRAVPMSHYLSSRGRYEGVDVVPSSIEWCRSNITTRNPRFRFQACDGRSGFADPKGAADGSSFRLSYPDETFDVALFLSGFTRLLPDAARTYVREIARTLRRAGRVMFSLFLLNAEAQRHLSAGAGAPGPAFEFDRVDDGHSVHKAGRPESAVGYEESFFLGLCVESGLWPLQPLHYGSWCGRSEFLAYEDVVVVEKRAPGARGRD